MSRLGLNCFWKLAKLLETLFVKGDFNSAMLCFEQPFLMLHHRKETSVQESFECIGKQIKAHSCCNEKSNDTLQALFVGQHCPQCPSTMFKGQFCVQLLNWVLARELWVLQTMTL